MLNGEINIYLGAIPMLIHPQLEGALKGLQVVLRSSLFIANNDLHFVSNVLHAIRKHLIFIVADEFHGLAKTKQEI
jgi:hypothetical protein